MLNTLEDKDLFTIWAPERFVFTEHKDFREALQSALASGKQVAIDFSQCQYIDSSALGMILLARDRLTKGLKLVKTKGVVQSVFQIANFHKLFEIS